MTVPYRVNILKSLTVKEAMRRQVLHLPRDASFEQAIRCMIKYKLNGVLITNEQLEALGVLTNSDLMGAYYAGLPLNNPVEAIMVSHPLFCHANDSLDSALDTMRAHEIHRLYVWRDVPNRAVGVVAYTDIVGLIYRYCSNCEKSILRGPEAADRPLVDHFRIKEVMTAGFLARRENETLSTLMENLAAHRFGALLIQDQNDFPVGVVSKTDIIIAYKHGISAESQARTVMNSPVQSSDQNDLLANALRKMILSDIQHLFIYKGAPANLVGVLSLSDVARFRSGTCRACVSSRIRI
jgi:predicted transcriptional regulator